MIPKDSLLGSLQSRYTWKKVQRPYPWRPKEVGEEIIGFYGGRTIRNGQFGQYEVVLVHVPADKSYLISGVDIIQAIDVAQIEAGWPVRIAWRGTEEWGEPDKDGRRKTKKKYEVFVAEGERIPKEFLPQIEPQAETRQ